MYIQAQPTLILLAVVEEGYSSSSKRVQQEATKHLLEYATSMSS